MSYRAGWIIHTIHIMYLFLILSIFLIYVDAPEDLLQTWYINRFLKFREGAFTDPDSYFHNYAKLTKEEGYDCHDIVERDQLAELKAKYSTYS